MKANTLNMCEGPYLKKIILYTIPIMLTALLQLAFNATDMIVIGQFCGSNYVGAVGVTGSLTTLFVNFFMGLSVGAGVSTAQGLGAKDDFRVHRTVHTALPIALICGLFLSLVGLVLSEPMLKIMDTPESQIDLAALYMKIYFMGSAPSLIYNFGASILRAAGDTRSPLIFLTAAGILNVGLNIIFVTVFHMDVDGVALATVLSQCASAVLVLVVLSKRKDSCRFSLRDVRIRKEPLLKILRIGVPSGIQTSLFSIANVQIQSAVNSFGDVFVSGNAAAANIGSFPLSAASSFYQSSVNFVGQNMGARRIENIQKIYKTCLACTMIVGIVMGALVALLGRPLLGIYLTGDENTEIAIGYGMIRIFCIYMPACLAGIPDIATGALRGMGNSLSPMIVTVLGVCVLRVVWIHTLFRWIPSPVCLFLSFPVSWLVTFIVLHFLYRKELKKHELKGLSL